MSHTARAHQHTYFGITSGMCTSIGMFTAVVLMLLFLSMGRVGAGIAGPLFLFLCSKGLGEWLFWKRHACLIPSSEELRRIPTWVWGNLAICGVLMLGELACEIWLVHFAVQSGMIPMHAFFYLAGSAAVSAWLFGCLADMVRRKAGLIAMFVGCSVIVFLMYELPNLSPLILLCCKGALVHVWVVARAAASDSMSWSRQDEICTESETDGGL